MAQKKTKAKPAASKTPPLSGLWRQASIAKKMKLSRQTLSSAVERGHIKAHQTACGVALVTEAAVQAYLDNPPLTGYHAHKARQLEKQPAKKKAKQ